MTATSMPSSPGTPALGATPTASGGRVARAFGLQGDSWMRHANPTSVWTRFAAVPALALAIWSRDWIGWLSLLPVVVSIVWIAVNPLFFKPPRSTRSWASKGVLGERVWTEGDRATFPAQFRTKVITVIPVLQSAGALAVAYGLVVLDPMVTVTGLVLMQASKAWYIDRMVLLFDDMKSRNAEYAAWDY